MDENTKNVYVVDASFVLAFILDEGNNEVESIFEKYALGEVDFIAPAILKYEVGNSLRTKFLRKKIKKKKIKKMYQSFLAIKINEKDFDFYEVLKFALDKKLSFYDASYLYLALSNKLHLLTLDPSLK